MINCLLEGDEVPNVGDSCRFSCNDGFELSGSRTRRCQMRNNRLRWSGRRTVCTMGMMYKSFVSLSSSSLLLFLLIKKITAFRKTKYMLVR